MLHQLTIVAVAASGLLASVTTTSAETITVCAKGCDYTEIQSAIDAASPGDTVSIAAGLYRGETLTISTEGITLSGVASKATPVTILDGEAVRQVLCIDAPGKQPTRLVNLTIQNGLIGNDTTGSCQGGGGIGTLTDLVVEDCVLLANGSFRPGGAVLSEGGSVLLRRVRIEGNWSFEGGGGIRGNSITAENCMFNANGFYPPLAAPPAFSPAGGAVLGEDTFRHCIFLENAAAHRGQWLSMASLRIASSFLASRCVVIISSRNAS